MLNITLLLVSLSSHCRVTLVGFVIRELVRNILAITLSDRTRLWITGTKGRPARHTGSNANVRVTFMTTTS